MRVQLFGMVMAGICSMASAADPWADAVVSYDPGETVGGGAYQADGGTQSLGQPTRDTGSGAFASQVGVFFAPYNVDQLTSIGPGGHLTVRFDEPVSDDAGNPFGIDLLIFGNNFYGFDAGGVATGDFAEEGMIEVSQDNATWHQVPAVFADAGFPTVGYVDTMYDMANFVNAGGTVPTDFTMPVDPSFDPLGLTEAEINDAYNGSGGGTGVDLASVGLEWIQYVRIVGAEGGIEVDALADVRAVPEPASIAPVLLAATTVAFRRLRRAGR